MRRFGQRHRGRARRVCQHTGARADRGAGWAGSGDHPGAIVHWREAHRLFPDNWTYKRQAWNFEDPVRQGHTDAYDGSWFEDIKQIGAENYYPPIIP